MVIALTDIFNKVIFRFRYKFGSNSRSNCSGALFMKWFYLLVPKQWHFGVLCILEEEAKGYFLPNQLQNFATFLPMFSLHHKWNKPRSLPPEIECPSGLTSCRATKHWEFLEILGKSTNWVQRCLLPS